MLKPTAHRSLCHIAPAMLVSVFVLIVMAISVRDFGLTTDEAFYIDNAERIANWFDDFGDVGFVENVTSEKRLREGWNYARPESKNLPLVSVVGQLGYVLIGRFDSPNAGYRWGNLILFAVTCGVIFHWARAALSTSAGVVAVLALVGNPRLFAHASLLSMDPLVGCFWVLASFALSRARENWRWSIGFAVLAGIGATAKPTFWFAFPVWIAWACLYRPRELWRAGVGLLTVTPLVALSLLPMWWTDPLGGARDYVAMMRGGAQGWETGTYYLGELYQLDGIGAPPWHAVVVLAAITTPIWILALGTIGLVRWLSDRRRDEVAALWVFSGAILPLIIMLPSTPAHDGVRLFRPAFFFLALLAGGGFEWCRRRWIVRPSAADTERAACGLAEPRREVPALAVALVLACLPHWKMHPAQLSYYNQFVGGFRGAAAPVELPPTQPVRRRPRHEISYWYDLLDEDAWKSMQAELPEHVRLWIFPEHPGARRLKQWGHLRSDVIVENRPDRAEYVLLYGRMSRLMDRRVTPLGSMFLKKRPLWEHTVDGVRVAALYRWAPAQR